MVWLDCSDCFDRIGRRSLLAISLVAWLGLTRFFLAGIGRSGLIRVGATGLVGRVILLG